jgi:metal-responsive CopG/Arc/MetJ family transcriptional regulator
MRASVTLDDDLLKTAHEYTGMTERAELLREALKSIIAREAGRRPPAVSSMLLTGYLAFPSRHSARWSNEHFGRNAERCMQTANHADG